MITRILAQRCCELAPSSPQFVRVRLVAVVVVVVASSEVSPGARYAVVARGARAGADVLGDAVHRLLSRRVVVRRAQSVRRPRESVAIATTVVAVVVAASIVTVVARV